jgi:4-amino-4-deoxy-L-arabinose transferase-like glycosyltransferase
MFSSRRPETASLLTFLFAFAMACVLIAGTPLGLGLSPDSVSYFISAKALAENHDFMQLPSHWPPLFPMMLAGVDMLVGDSYLTARLLQAVFIVINIVLIYRLLEFTGQPKAANFLLLILIALQPSFLTVHLMLWSEPAFLSFVLLDIMLLARVVSGTSNRRLLIVLGLTCGLAVMVRYAGLFLLIVNAVTLFFYTESQKRLVDRFKTTAWISTLSIAPMLAWSLFNRIRNGHFSDRGLVWHPIDQQHVSQGINTLAGWFHLPGALGWLVLLCMIVALFWSLKQKMADSQTATTGITRVMALYLLTYSAFLIVSISVADNYTPLSPRILIPMLPVSIVLMAELTSGAKQHWLPLLVLGAMIIGLTLNVPEAYGVWRQNRVNGTGFASRIVQQWSIMSTLKGMPPTWKVATNGPEFFELYLRPRAQLLPKKSNPVNRQPNADYTKDVQQMAQTSNAIVYFTAMRNRYYLPSANELNRVPGFHLVYAQPDGTIWVKD